MKINCIAIDDEPLALEIIEEYAQKIPYLNLCKTFTNAINALEYIKNKSIDLIFLDIQMPDITGLQLSKLIPESTSVIFTTAYCQYAVDSYELNATDYLLKPFDFTRFLKASEKVLESKKHNNPANNKANEIIKGNSVNHIFVKTEYRIERVEIDEIFLVEGMKNYLRIYTNDKKIMTLSSFKNMEDLLPSIKFMRVHKSYIIALDKIDKIENNRIYINDNIVPIGDSYKSAFNSRINSNSL